MGKLYSKKLFFHLLINLKENLFSKALFKDQTIIQHLAKWQEIYLAGQRWKLWHAHA